MLHRFHEPKTFDNRSCFYNDATFSVDCDLLWSVIYCFLSLVLHHTWLSCWSDQTRGGSKCRPSKMELWTPRVEIRGMQTKEFQAVDSFNVVQSFWVCEGELKAIEGLSLSALGYHLLPLATSQLVSNNREFDGSGIFGGVLLIVYGGELITIEGLSLSALGTCNQSVSE